MKLLVAVNYAPGLVLQRETVTERIQGDLSFCNTPKTRDLNEIYSRPILFVYGESEPTLQHGKPALARDFAQINEKSNQMVAFLPKCDMICNLEVANYAKRNYQIYRP